jgi:hypothetical protein
MAITMTSLIMTSPTVKNLILKNQNIKKMENTKRSSQIPRRPIMKSMRSPNKKKKSQKLKR